MQPITDPEVLAGYLTDASNIPGQAEGLLRPETTEEVAAIVAHCQTHGIPLTVTAARTSTTGSATPQGGWVLSMERMKTLHHIGAEHASAQAAINLSEFQTAIEAEGRLFPPDPTSRTDCTLGAAIACNASGARSFKYGPTRPWIEALTVVLPTGEILRCKRGDAIPADWPEPAWTEPAVKTAAGFAPPRDLVDLFIGQEGTLGIITEATVRLTTLPTDVMSLIAYFPDRQAAVRFVEHARAAAKADSNGALSPRCLEYFDKHCLELARTRLEDVPDGATAALFCEQEVVPAIGEDAHMEAWWTALEELGALADDTLLTTDPAGRAKLHAFRHAIPAGINEEVVRNGMRKVGTDLSVPDTALDAMMTAYEQAPLRHVLFGHIGDNHLHLNLLPTNLDELATAKAFYDELARQAIALGGSVSAEHGIGKLKKEQLAWMVGQDVLDSFRALKNHLDPNWILGRGNVVDRA